jgi:hypothetical protein
MSVYTKTEEHFVSSDPWENLAAAIIIKAVEDWRRAIHCQNIIWGEHLMVQDRQAALEELRSFFLSDWCAVLCPVPPSEMLLRLEREYAESALRKIGVAKSVWNAQHNV